MNQVRLVKLRLVEGKEKVWLDWCNELQQRKDEVIETLKNEKVLSEACFLADDEKCVYYFMEAEDFEKAREAVAKSTHAIDREHKEKRKLSLEKVADLKELFHFENRTRGKN